MKTKKEVEDASGVTLNHFAEGKSHKSAERSPGFVLCVEVMFGPREEKFGSLAAKFIAKTLFFTAVSPRTSLRLTGK